jgi:pyrroloquinoline quinone (PQQ) biosynthesis protein C
MSPSKDLVSPAPSPAAGFGESPASFVADLAEVSLRHRAVRHPYLKALVDGTLPDTRWALADFARQYYGYSKHFPRYLTAVISRLENPAHRAALLCNLTEESGTYDDNEIEALAAIGVKAEWIVGIPHPVLFRRFATAMEVRFDAPEADAVACWREVFLGVLSTGTAAEAVGALGLGTENIVSTMYTSFLAALARVNGLSPRDTVFFPLHTAVDDHHQATLQAIATELAVNETGRQDLRRGMLKALQLRSAFWDWMYARALAPNDAHSVV